MNDSVANVTGAIGRVADEAVELLVSERAAMRSIVYVGAEFSDFAATEIEKMVRDL
jgi:hypothetical protein